MNRKVAFITGITGQDGSYLAEQLVRDGYEVHGLVRRSSMPNLGRLWTVFQKVVLHVGDLTDGPRLMQLIRDIKPTEVYNLGAMSHVKVSFETPSYSVDTICQGTLNMLEAVRHFAPEARFYQASSSEMFGDVLEPRQSETTPFRPQSPYGCAKVFAHHLVVNYRKSYGLHASCGILFNHESPRRGETFVTRKISKAVAAIVKGQQRELRLGNLEAKRDWGYAPEFVEGMRLMLQKPFPADYVLATGETHTVQEFVVEAFNYVNLSVWDHVLIDPALKRPSEVDLLLGNFEKAELQLGWRPRVTFKELVKIMVEADLRGHE